MLEKTLESPLDCKEIQPVHPKWNQSWIFIGGTDAEAVAPMLWLLVVKDWPIRKDPDAGKDWRQEKRMTEDETVGWHHRLMDMSLSKFWELVMGRPGSLACCSPQRHKEQDRTEQLNWTETHCQVFALLRWRERSQAAACTLGRRAAERPACQLLYAVTRVCICVGHRQSEKPHYMRTHLFFFRLPFIFFQFFKKIFMYLFGCSRS